MTQGGYYTFIPAGSVNDSPWAKSRSTDRYTGKTDFSIFKGLFKKKKEEEDVTETTCGPQFLESTIFFYTEKI